MDSPDFTRELEDIPLQRRTIADYRKYFLALLKREEDSGMVKKLRWDCAPGRGTCKKCRSRHRKSFTFDELEEILKGDFCDGDDEDEDENGKKFRPQYCRCVLLSVAKSLKEMERETKFLDGDVSSPAPSAPPLRAPAQFSPVAEQPRKGCLASILFFLVVAVPPLLGVLS